MLYGGGLYFITNIDDGKANASHVLLIQKIIISDFCEIIWLDSGKETALTKHI